MNEIIKLKNINYSYDKKVNVLSNINLSILSGQDISIIGHNGSGKSTLGKVLNALVFPNSGTYIFNEKEINEKTENIIRGKVGIVFQNPDNQFIGSTVELDVAFGLENKCIEHSKMHELVDSYLEKVNLKDLKDKEPNNLSGGQKQRVAIASILALEPEVIIFDEATSMLDPVMKKEILNLIKKIKIEKPNTTIIRITHDLDETLDSDRVIVLDKGKIVLDDTPFNVYKNELIKDLKIEKPFLIELNEKLISNGLINKECFDYKELIKNLCK